MCAAGVFRVILFLHREKLIGNGFFFLWVLPGTWVYLCSVPPPAVWFEFHLSTCCVIWVLSLYLLSDLGSIPWRDRWFEFHPSTCHVIWVSPLYMSCDLSFSPLCVMWFEFHPSACQVIWVPSLYMSCDLGSRFLGLSRALSSSRTFKRSQREPIAQCMV